jgi:hypothetical protein
VSDATTDEEAPDATDPVRAPVEVRCESCRSVVSTRHAWDAVTCACGRLTVSGRPTKPTVAWIATPGGGWSEAGGSEADRGDGDDQDGDAHDAPVTPRRPIGFAP